MKTFKLTIGLLVVISVNTYSQVISTNRNPVGMEHNVLFNATTRYTVKQTGDAQLSLAVLFDGNFSPYYSAVAVNPSNPTVITIEGLPYNHVQAGAWVGWTTRYWPAKRFKIEAYNAWEGATVGWITVADYSNNDYGDGDFTAKLPYIVPTSLRFTFYEGNGDGGRFGLSEIYYINTEATRPYEGLLKYDEGATGTMNAGTDNGSTSGYGSKLNFLGASENTDPLWIARYNNGSNNSELRINITDDLGQAADKFVVGTTDNLWHPILTVQNDRQIIADAKITATEIQVKLDVWADYVFHPTYRLKPLAEVEQYIKTHGHLENIPTAKEVQKDGVNIGDIEKRLLEKLEETTLYLIEQEKQNTELRQKLDEQEKKYLQLFKALEELKNKKSE